MPSLPIEMLFKVTTAFCRQLFKEKNNSHSVVLDVLDHPWCQEEEFVHNNEKLLRAWPSPTLIKNGEIRGDKEYLPLTV